MNGNTYLERCRELTAQWETDYQYAVRNLQAAKDEFEQADFDLEASAEALTVAREIAKEIQQQAHQRVSDVVTRCIKTVFGDDSYEFRIMFEEKRNKTEARIALIKDGQEISPPIDASGGGVIDVAAFALRIAVLNLIKPARRRFVVLDEPFRFVSADKLPIVLSLMEYLADTMEMQFLMVNHYQDLEVGATLRIDTSNPARTGAKREGE